MTSKSDKMGLHHAPMAFTEQGVAMISSVLNGDQVDPLVPKLLAWEPDPGSSSFRWSSIEAWR